MAKGKKKDNRQRIIGPEELGPNKRAEFNCDRCTAEFSIINEPDKPEDYPSRAVLCCPFCGNENIVRR